MGYFAGRAAPLGAVGPDVVEAVFYNFSPSRVARALPDAWTFAPPSVALNARLVGSVAALERSAGGLGALAEVAAELAARVRARHPSAGERCSPPTAACHGPTARSAASGMPRPSCVSTGATGTSPC